MREWLLGLALVLAFASCSFTNVERRHLADGSWQIACPVPMAECARQADQLCMDQRYRILRGSSTHGVRGAGPSQVEYRRSELTFVCGTDDQERAPSPGNVPTPPPVGSTETTAPATLVCTPGATQACVGPGGCAGGQACVREGSSFGPCDCGPPAPPGAGLGPRPGL